MQHCTAALLNIDVDEKEIGIKKDNTEPELEIIMFLSVIVVDLGCHDEVQPLYNGFLSYIFVYLMVEKTVKEVLSWECG